MSRLDPTSSSMLGIKSVINTDSAKLRIASVVLNYNSDADVVALVPQLLSQENIRHNIFIVDNASKPESINRLQSWVQNIHPDAVIGSPVEVAAQIKSGRAYAHADNNLYLVLNHENRGYSAGNNIGIRLAEASGSEAVLVANPDMRIDNRYYIDELANVLFSNEKNFIAASRIIGLEGKDQNPLREPTFWEELFWPKFFLGKIFRQPVSYILPIEDNSPITVPKVSGCCLMLSMAFLRTTDYLDENVFLYCEEPILSARVRWWGGNIIFVPRLCAIHAHERSKKDNSSRRMLIFFKSRKYYLKYYSKYGLAERALLYFSYATLKLFYRI